MTAAMARPRFADLRLLEGAELEEDDPHDFALADEAARWFSLPGGWTLFEAGEPSEEMYVLVGGALVVHRRGPDGGVELTGHIRSGEPVGEIGVITGERRSVTVSALRDSELLALPREAFVRLMREAPAFNERILKRAFARAQEPQRDRPRAEPRVFALIAASPSVDPKAAAETLAERVRALGKSCVIAGPEASERPTAWFDEAERDNDVVLVHARMSELSWYRTCLRHADRMWVLARRDGRPSTPMPLADDAGAAARSFRLVDLIILDEGADTGAPPRAWIEATGAHRLFRWRDDADAQRLARVISGRSVGLVLSGGGARAYAHIGAVRALREAEVPIDFIGGASMGAIIAAAVAIGWDDDEIDARVRAAFVDTNPLGDLRLPVVALAAGRRVEARLAEHFADTRIDELRTPFFAVSTNLSTARLRIHRLGLVREALRASIAIPGLIPPVVVEDDVLVDGAVINNFPVDVMQGLHRGPVIGVDVTRERGLAAEDFRDPPGFAGWIVRHGASEAPPIVSLLMRAATVHVDPRLARRQADCLILPKLTDVDLRAWKRYEPAVEAGYQAVREALADPPGALAEALRAKA